MTKEEIGKILKDLRIQAGMTQKDVAELIGRKQQVVGHWETGYSQPDADTLFMLCDIYHASVDDAFGFSKKITSEEDKIPTDVEWEIVKKYRSLDRRGQKAVLDTLNRECEFAPGSADAVNSTPTLIEDAIHTIDNLAGVTATINQHQPTSKK